jgi:hypothetical protein
VQFSDGHEADFLERDILAEAGFAPGDHELPAPRLWDATLQLPARRAGTARRAMRNAAGGWRSSWSSVS